MLDQEFREKTIFLAAPNTDLLVNPVIRQWARDQTALVDGHRYLVALHSNAEGRLDAMLVDKPSLDAYQVALQAFFRRRLSS